MKDGMYENVFTILVVGMSIDYSVHLAHFYNHASGTRYEKAREAMYGVGVSVLGGAITTIGAGIPLSFYAWSCSSIRKVSAQAGIIIISSSTHHCLSPLLFLASPSPHHLPFTPPPLPSPPLSRYRPLHLLNCRLIALLRVRLPHPVANGCGAGGAPRRSARADAGDARSRE